MLLCRFNVTSRKLTTCLFASMVMRSPLRLNIWQISFLMFSVCLGVALVIASPSSRFVVFQCNECFFIGCFVHSVVDA